MFFKFSKYNIYFEYKNSYYLFNTIHCGFAKINKNNKKLINKYKTDKFKKSNLPKNFFQKMYEKQFIVGAESNEKDILKSKFVVNNYQKNMMAILITITFDCNFNCIYCYENNKKIKMDEKTINKMLKFITQKAKKYNKLIFTWFGGEPLLETEKMKKITNKIVNLCNKNNCSYKFKIVTNGYLINKILDNVEKLKLSYFQITLDGPKDIHNKKRSLKNGEGSYERIMSNIRKLNKLKTDIPIDINIRINIDKENYIYIKKLIDEIEDFKNQENNLYLTVPPVSPNSIEDLNKCFTTKKYAEQVELDIYKYAQKKELSTYLSDFNLVPFPRTYADCSALQNNSIIIGPKGNVYKCYKQLMTEEGVVGKLNRKGNIVYNYENLSFWSNYDPFKDKKCKDCKYLPLCYGNCLYNRRISNNKVGCKTLKYNLKEKLKMYLNQKLH